MSIKLLFKGSLALSASLIGVASTYQLIHLISPNRYGIIKNDDNTESNTQDILVSLSINAVLISVFCLYLSFQEKVKEKLGRNLSLLFYGLVIEVLLYGWKPVNSITFWSIRGYIFASFSMLAYFLSLLMFIVSILWIESNHWFGLKALWYEYKELEPDFISSKTQRLYEHMGYPNYLALLVVLWFVPIMTLDRFLLASVLTLYQLYMSQVDKKDVERGLELIDRVYQKYVENLNPWNKKKRS